MKGIAQLIRVKLADGRLPRKQYDKLFGSHGSREPCDACGEIIGPAQIEYELEFRKGEPIRLHLGCFGIYEAQRLRGAGQNSALRQLPSSAS